MSELYCLSESSYWFFVSYSSITPTVTCMRYYINRAFEYKRTNFSLMSDFHKMALSELVIRDRSCHDHEFLLGVIEDKVINWLDNNSIKYSIEVAESFKNRSGSLGGFSILVLTNEIDAMAFKLRWL